MALLTLVTMAPWAAVGAALVFMVPRFEAIFSDFGVELPLIAVWVLNASRAIVGAGPGTLAAAGAGVALVALVVFGAWMASTERNRAPGQALLVVVALGGAVAVAGTVAALYAPLMAMIESLQKQGAA